MNEKINKATKALKKRNKTERIVSEYEKKIDEKMIKFDELIEGCTFGDLLMFSHMISYELLSFGGTLKDYTQDEIVGKIVSNVILAKDAQDKQD